MTYTYRSEGAHGQATHVAHCPIHKRDLTVHGSKRLAMKVAEVHERLFHPW